MNVEAMLPIDGGFLRVLKEQDVHQGYVDGLNDPEVTRYLDGVKLSVQTEKMVCDFVSADYESTSSILWGVWTDNMPEHVGTVRMHGIEHRHGTACVGICLFDKRSWGCNLGSKSIRAVTQWGLCDLGLRWIEAAAYAKNIASHKAFLQAGYDWIHDISGKYLLEGQPETVSVFAARAGATSYLSVLKKQKRTVVR